MKQQILNIGIDGNEANVIKRVGSNVYAYQIIKSLSRLPGIKMVIYLKDAPLHDMPQPSSVLSYRRLTPKKAWTQWRLPLHLYVHPRQHQVFFSPGHYAPRKSPIPTVTTILDVSFLKYPNLFLKYERGVHQLTSWTKYSAQNAAHIITISQHTKKDIIHYYQKSPDQVSVAYPGIDTNRFAPASENDQQKVRDRYHLPPKFILYVGTLQPRKNLIRLIQAFENLPPKYNKFHLVLAGQRGWLADDIFNKIHQSKQKGRIITPGFISDADLAPLYSAAACTVLIGLEEGFGIPPAESLSCGTIPVVSKTSSLPEVVGEAGILVDPQSLASITHGLSAALDMPPTKKTQRLKIAASHLQQFNWHKSATIIKKVLYDVAIQK